MTDVFHALGSARDKRCALRILRSELDRLLSEIKHLNRFAIQDTPQAYRATDVIELKMPYLFEDYRTLATFGESVVQKLCELNVEIATANCSLIGRSEHLLRDLCHAEIAVQEALDELSNMQDCA